MQLLSAREPEKQGLQAKLAARQHPPAAVAEILPHPMLLKLFKEKVAVLHAALDNHAVRPEATAIIGTLIESMTIHPGGERGPEAEVSDLMEFATNDNAATKGGVSSSITAVTGTGPISHNGRNISTCIIKILCTTDDCGTPTDNPIFSKIR